MSVKSRESIIRHSEEFLPIGEYFTIACIWGKIPALDIERTDHVFLTDGPCLILSGEHV
jgi:hypothetical protein